jgi:PAS domain S-box-containing protein/putative nucleotidyltransferase with HDIG domain
MKSENKTKKDFLQELAALREEISKLKILKNELFETRELHQTLADRSPIGVYVLQNGAFQYINPQFKASTGFTEADLLGKDSLSIVHPADRTGVRENAVRMLKGKRTSPYEFRSVTKDGRIRWVLGTVISIPFRGKPAVLGNYMDITDQKEAREKLEDLEALEASILDALPVAVVGLRERRVIFANRAVETVFGWKPEELIGKNTRILYRSDEEYEEIGRHFYPVLEKQRTYNEEYPCRHRDGRDIICMVSTSRIGDSLTGKSIVATYEDITERKRVEAALRESEGRLSSIIQGSPIPTFVIGRDHRVTHWNRSLEELSGLAAKDTIGTTEHWRAFYSQERPCMADLLVDGERGKVSQWYAGKCQKSKLIEDAYEATDFFPTLGTEGKWLRFTAATIRDSAGHIVGAVETLEDITDEKQAEETLKESESRLREILEGSPTPTVVIDKNHQVIVWNRAMEELSAIRASEVLHTDQQWRIFYNEKRPLMADLLVDENIEEVKEIPHWYAGKYVKSRLLQDAYEATDYSAVRGKWLHFTSAVIHDTSGNILGAVETMTDISPLKQAEEDLRKSLEKLQKAMTGTVEAMAVIVETRDPYTAGHQHQVAKISRRIAEEMKLPQERLEALEMAAYIHDIGKIYVPAEILSKPGKLSEVELNIIKTHPQVAFEILKNIEFPWPIADIVYQHHERLNGTGYPRGLKEGGICLESRIIGVVDVFESMASHRPYRPTLGLERAVDELTKNRGILYDPAVVDILLKLVKQKKIEVA